MKPTRGMKSRRVLDETILEECIMKIKYEPEMDYFIIREKAAGKTSQQVASDLGISLYTWCKWKEKYPTFNTADRIGQRIFFDKITERFT